MFRRIPAVPAESAAQVQNPFPVKIRQHPFQRFPFSGSGQSLDGTVHLAVFPEKGIFVVLVLLHGGGKGGKSLTAPAQVRASGFRMTVTRPR